MQKSKIFSKRILNSSAFEADNVSPEVELQDSKTTSARGLFTVCLIPLDINVTSWFIIPAMFTVKQLSKLAGVTPRTLHHYDAIGLLKPTRVGENGYRYYGEECLLRLQQILLYRELDLPLDDIKKIMGRRDFDVLGALQRHKDALQKQVAQTGAVCWSPWTTPSNI